MQTLALVNGDLAIDGTGDYLTFSGNDRIKQDLTHALVENYGSNRFHPKWGSIVGDFLGQVNNVAIQAATKAEINRVLQNYIILQQAEVLRDTQFDIAGRYNTADVVQSVQKIDVRANFDSLYFTINLLTIARETITISRQAGI